MEIEPLIRFTSIREIQLKDLLDVLDKWELGEVHATDVLVFAEYVENLAGDEWHKYSRHDSRSVQFGVLEALVTLHLQPILKDDIPALRQFLTLGEEAPLKAWQFIDTYWDSIEWEKRLQE